MRISEQKAEKIKSLTVGLLGISTKVWLFGSGVDDKAKDGNIDLFVNIEGSIERLSVTFSEYQY